MLLQQQFYKKARKVITILIAFFIVGMLNPSSTEAQSSYQNLILSSDYNRHFLSPYLTRYPQSSEIRSAQDILSKKSLQRENFHATKNQRLF